MKMKKLLAVAVTLCLLLCAMLPMAASAVEVGMVSQYLTLDEDMGAYVYDTAAGGTAYVEIAAGETAVIVVEGGAGAEFAAYGYDTENFEDAEYYVILSRMFDGQYWATGETSGTLAGDNIQIYNANEFAIHFKIAFDTAAGGGSSDPVGTYNNPEVIPDMGVFMGGMFTHDFVGASEPYFYKWTALADGEFSVTIMGTDGPGGADSVGWTYSLENADGNIYGDNHWNNDDDVVATDSISVSAGDTVTVMLGTYDPDNWGYPDGSVTFQVGFAEYGSPDLPYPLSAGVNEYTIDSDMNHYAFTANTVTKIVLSGAGDSWEYVEGEWEELTADADGNYTFVLAAGESIVLNPGPTSYEGSDITITVTEKGSEEWPIEVEADEEYTSPNTFWPGSFFSFTAEEDGTLIIDFGEYTDWLILIGEDEYAGEGESTYAEIEVTAGEVVFNIMDWRFSWDGEFAVVFETPTQEPVTPPTNDNPKTGDMGVIMAAVAAVSSACGAAFVCKKKG